MKNHKLFLDVFNSHDRLHIYNEALTNWTTKRDPEWININNRHGENSLVIDLLAKRIYKAMATNWDIKINKNSGLELWININKRQGLHYDCDETLRQMTGLMRYPSLSGVYYSIVPSFGGDLILFKEAFDSAISNVYNKNINKIELGNATKIKPTENSLIVFEPKIPHYVEEWDPRETRISIAANLWIDEPINPKKPFSALLSKL